MNRDDFMECDLCRVKPGTPMLCEPCIHNRRLIGELKESLREAKAILMEMASLMLFVDDARFPLAAKLRCNQASEWLLRDNLKLPQE